MISHELAIEQLEPSDNQPCHQPGESHFGCIAGAGEHTLPAKSATDHQAIQAADQRAIAILTNQPAFHTMGPTVSMQRAKGFFDICVNPCFTPVICRLGADRNYICKCLVTGGLKTVRPNRFAQRTRHVETIKRQNRTCLRLYPKCLRIIACIGHRENAGRISLQ